MFHDSEKPGQSSWAKAQQYGWILVAAVFLYVAAATALRWRENREIDRKNQEKAAAKQTEADRKTFEAMGGSRLEILAFYATPPEIHRGERSQLCYGVSNASALSISPEVEPIRPSYGRCVDVFPRKVTTYTLTATDAAGHTQTATAAVRVQ